MWLGIRLFSVQIEVEVGKKEQTVSKAVRYILPFLSVEVYKPFLHLKLSGVGLPSKYIGI